MAELAKPEDRPMQTILVTDPSPFPLAESFLNLIMDEQFAVILVRRDRGPAPFEGRY